MSIEPSWLEFTKAEQFKEAVAARQAQCRLIDDDIAQLRERKGTISREIAAIEQHEMLSRVKDD